MLEKVLWIVAIAFLKNEVLARKEGYGSGLTKLFLQPRVNYTQIGRGTLHS
jgi:hypothetical protein